MGGKTNNLTAKALAYPRISSGNALILLFQYLIDVHSYHEALPIAEEGARQFPEDARFPRIIAKLKVECQAQESLERKENAEQKPWDLNRIRVCMGMRIVHL